MFRRSDAHFHDKGDIELIVEGVTFRVHREYLAMGSRFFMGKLTSARPSSDDEMGEEVSTRTSVPRMRLTDVSAQHIEKMLSFLYPEHFIEIDWDDVADMLRLAKLYQIEKLRLACEAFLRRSYREEPLRALALAERYGIQDVYKESSKLVLNDFEHLFYDVAADGSKELSRDTQVKLKVSRQEYVEGLNKLYSVTVDRQFPPLSSEHLRTLFEKCVKDLCTFPLPRPAETWRQLHQVDCPTHFECREELRRLKSSIHEKITALFGQYEPIAWQRSRSSPDPNLYYPYIELE